MKSILPRNLLDFARKVRSRLLPDYQKYHAELSFWQVRFKNENRRFRHDHFERIMLAMAGESSDSFLADKTVVDFGCGPRGSLVWAKSAAVRVGVDALADRYFDEFGEDLATHDMIYLKATEKNIPLPSGFADVVFTLNAIDHVDDFPAICREILRILKPGGLFIGSFNLEEPETATEPQRLTEEAIRAHLLDPLNVGSYRISAMGPPDNTYGPLLDNQPLDYRPGSEGILWVRASRPRSS